MRHKNSTDVTKRATDMIQRRILFDRRIIMLTGEIDEDSSRDIIESLMALDCLKKAPIMMRINSIGGHIDQGLAIIDTINMLRSPVHTAICGEACSMATLVALYGKKRLMTQNSAWMGHEMSRWGYDYYSKEKYRFKHEEEVWLEMRKMYEAKTKLTKKDMKLIDHGELWLTAQQCLEKGIIDRIGG